MRVVVLAAGAVLVMNGSMTVGELVAFVGLISQVLTPATRITVANGQVVQELRAGTDLLPMISLGEGQPDPRRQVDADVVFAGYATTSTALHRDDFASIDLTDRVVVFLHGAPPGATP